MSTFFWKNLRIWVKIFSNSFFEDGGSLRSDSFWSQLSNRLNLLIILKWKKAKQESDKFCFVEFFVDSRWAEIWPTKISFTFSMKWAESAVTRYLWLPSYQLLEYFYQPLERHHSLLVIESMNSIFSKAFSVSKTFKSYRNSLNTEMGPLMLCTTKLVDHSSF